MGGGARENRCYLPILNSSFPCQRKRKLLEISMDEILPDFYRTGRKMPHMVKKGYFLSKQHDPT
jgi:hypothetical protein